VSNISKAARTLASAKVLNSTILVVGVLMAVYHLLVAFVILQGQTTHLATFLTLILLLGLLIKFRDDTKIRRYLALALIPIALAVMAYIFANSERLEGTFEFITDLDLIVGIALVTVVFITAWLWWGPPIPLMIALAVAYFIWGHLLSGYLYHPYFSTK